MKAWVRFLGGVGFIFVLSCATFYHMQTPETVPPRKVQVGVGGFYTPSIRVCPAGPWVRTGITPKIDIGFYPLLLGLKIDTKINLISDYLAAGVGAGYFATTFWEFEAKTYILEGSVYLGYPGRVLYPYGVGRFTMMERTDMADGPLITAAGGLRIRPWRRFSIYVEAGMAYSFGWESDSPYYDDIPPSVSPMGGLGFSAFY